MITRMQVGIVAASLLIVTLTATAQGVDVEPGQHWKVNDEARYERLTTRTDSGPARSTTARTPIAIKVIEASPKGYVLSWKHGPVELTPPASERTEPVEALKALMADLELVIDVDARGRFVSLRNWEQVRDAALPLVDKMPMPASMPDAAKKEQLALRRNFFATKAGIENVLLSEVKLFFLLYGRRLVPDEDAKYDQVTNPLGGPRLPAILTIRLERADAQAATIRYTLTMDREKAGEAIAETFRGMAARMGKSVSPEEVAAVASSLKIDDTIVLVLDLATRFPESLASERAMEMMGRSRVDRVDYRRRP